MTQVLVDAETEHSQTWPLSRFHPLSSSFSIRTDEIIGHSFSTKHGKYKEVKKFWFGCQYSMISPNLHQIFWHCRTSTIILVFTPRFQSNYKIKRDDFTEVLLSLTFGPLKIACHKGAFDMLHIFDLTSRPSCKITSSESFLVGMVHVRY